nr:hypothetical protein [Tanacetum cinerariifolium]
KEASQKYGASLPECLTSPQMKESKSYKTYLGYATGTVPPKVSRKFKKASPSKKDSVPVPADEEPIQKGKRVKRSAKKSLIRKKSLRDFYKSHPSGFGLAAKKPPSVEKITPPVISEGTGDKPRVPDVTKDDSTESESESLGNDDDDSNDKEGSEQENDSEAHESDSEQDTDGSESDSKSDQQDEVKVKDDDEDDDNYDDKSEGDEDRGMDSDEVQDKKADVRMMDAQQEIENLEITQEQVVEDAHVTIIIAEITRIKTNKDAEPTTSLKTKDSSSKSSKGTKSQPKSFRKSVHAMEPEFKVEDTNTPQGQEGN